MWTTENRHRYDRDKLRYPSDLTDAEWQLIKPLIPPAKRGGGKRTVKMREVVNGLMYVLEGKLQLDAGGLSEVLEAGDCAYVESDMALAWSASGKHRCRVLAVMPAGPGAEG